MSVFLGNKEILSEFFGEGHEKEPSKEAAYHNVVFWFGTNGKEINSFSVTRTLKGLERCWAQGQQHKDNADKSSKHCCVVLESEVIFK